MAEQDSGRCLLPTTVVPQHYELEFLPDLKAFTFSGKATVQLKVVEEVDCIELHVKEVEIDTAVLIAEDGSLISATVSYDKAEERATLSLASKQTVGVAMLKMEFRGILNDQMAGFYRSRYTNANGEERWMAVTQFEATDARRAFPCWDEPSLKATYSVAMVVPEHLQALSNMPVAEKSTKNGLTRYAFQKTVIMSSYLLAFVVGDFDVVSAQTKGGVAVSIYTQKGKMEQGRFALSVATRTLDLFSEYFEIDFPLPKCDMVAISDFAAGAMENWGLVTYRETALLIDAEKSGVSSRMRVAYVVAHELAHQWFGNLVTMQWWSELWLNEGFATWVGTMAVDQLYPDWDVWTGFGSSYFARALGLDGLKNSHPIEVDVKNSSQINEIFDTISYAKGASVIRMVHAFIGAEAFRKGLVIYLNRHKYSNATTANLWAALSEASGRDVGEFMDNWTKKTGYPVLHVEPVDGSNQLKISQKRFFLSGEDGDDDVVWWCSVPFLTSSSSEPVTLDVKARNEVVELPQDALKNESGWLVANAGQFNFYRVHYSSALQKSLGDAIESGRLDSLDRVAIQGDLFALARNGSIKTSEALSIVQSYAKETNDTVLSDLAGNIGLVASAWSEQDNLDQLRAFASRLWSPMAAEFGWIDKEGDSDLDKVKRSLVVDQAGKYGDERVIQQAKELLQSGATVASDLKYTMYKLAVQHGGEEEYEKVLEVYRTAELHTEKLQALRALGASKDQALISRTLDFGFSEEVRTQDLIYVYGAVAANLEGRALAWQFLQDHWDGFMTKLEGTGFIMASIVGRVTSVFSTNERAEEVEQFFKEHPAPMAERTIQQSLESIRSKTAWVARDADDVKAFLASQ